MKISAAQIAVGDVLDLGGLVDITYLTEYDAEAAEYWGTETMAAHLVTVESIEAQGADQFEIWVLDHDTNVRGSFIAYEDGSQQFETSDTR